LARSPGSEPIAATTSMGGKTGCNVRDLDNHLVYSTGETSAVSAMTCSFD
jgi:hypothetical protein